MQTAKTISQPTQWLTPTQAAEMIGLTPGALACWRCTGRSNQPKFYKTSHKIVRYKLSDIESWLESQSFAY